MKTLAVFDFDHTIINDNSDTAIFPLVGSGEIPQELKSIQCKDGWTAFMQAMFSFLHDKGVKSEEIMNVVKNLPPVDGMIDLITNLHKDPNFDLIIISDSNSNFINKWLENHGLVNCFAKVFTNPSEIVNDKIIISPYHIQETCKLSTKNLCKGQILDEFIESQQESGIVYDKVIYIGDGVNDFCPVLHLKLTDLACARNKYKLVELINKAKKGNSLENSGKQHVVKAELLVWDTANDIWKHLTK